MAACVAAMRAGAGRHRRTRATWLPASLDQLPGVRAASLPQLDLKARVDRAV